MVQVLPYVPSFLEQLTPQLKQATGEISGFLENRVKLNRIQEAEKVLLDPNSTPIQKVAAYSKMPDEYKKHASPVWASVLGPEAQSYLNQKQLQNFTNPQTTSNASSAPGQPEDSETAPALGNPSAPRTKLQSLTDDELAMAKAQGGAVGALAETEMQIRNDERKASTKYISKYTEEAGQKREILRKEKMDLQQGLNAVQSGEVKGFDQNWLAERLGAAGEPLKNVSGVQLGAASKNVLVDTIQKVAGRPNQWLDQQIQAAGPSIGKSSEANETLIKTALAKNDIDQKMIDVKDDLVAGYQKNRIAVPANIDKVVEEVVKPYAQAVQSKLSYDLRVLYERQKGKDDLTRLKKVAKGTPLTREKATALQKKFGWDEEKIIETAKNLGFTVLPQEVVERELDVE